MFQAYRNGAPYGPPIPARALETERQERRIKELKEKQKRNEIQSDLYEYVDLHFQQLERQIARNEARNEITRQVVQGIETNLARIFGKIETLANKLTRGERADRLIEEVNLPFRTYFELETALAKEKIANLIQEMLSEIRPEHLHDTFVSRIIRLVIGEELYGRLYFSTERSNYKIAGKQPWGYRLGQPCWKMTHRFSQLVRSWLDAQNDLTDDQVEDHMAKLKNRFTAINQDYIDSEVREKVFITFNH